jgi:hypothetical protein
MGMTITCSMCFLMGMNDPYFFVVDEYDFLIFFWGYYFQRTLTNIDAEFDTSLQQNLIILT